MPQPGERLILGDGRSFVLHRADEDIRGWWFKATIQDGSSTLEGNLRLDWDADAAAWRPRGTQSPSQSLTSRERRRQHRSRQAD